jgi:hypothetical protein
MSCDNISLNEQGGIPEQEGSEVPSNNLAKRDLVKPRRQLSERSKKILARLERLEKNPEIRKSQLII